MHRTRIKICGLTRDQDIRAAVAAGADAIGLVFYGPSPRFIAPDRARELAALAPPFVTRVGLFVNERTEFVREVISQVPLELLQFHGDEDEGYCRQFGMPYIKAIRVGPESRLLESAAMFPSARGLLFDAHTEAYGGAGQTFDWKLIPRKMSKPLIVSGGLNVGNVAEAIRRLRPWAVDVSSGVESSRGVKDADQIAAFVAAVGNADA